LAKWSVPGQFPDRFKEVVDTVADLRDSGKVLIFLGRSRPARIIGMGAKYEELVEDSLRKKEVGEDFSKEFGELAKILRFMSRARNVADTVSACMQMDSDNKVEAKQKNQINEALTKRVEVVFATLFVESLRNRAKRIDTATTPTLEELDYEVVAERLVENSDQCILDPFLRVKLRYVERGTQSFPQFIFLGDISEKSCFELECDESDLDFLMLRLSAAKNRLIKAREAIFGSSGTNG
jgi:hypothetical protein